jgi:putative transferase (TIGR04331 family)
MSKRFLITTALEQTIPNNQPLLLLGEWCKPFSKVDKFKNLDVKVLPYHWDDRSKLYKDYLYLDELYEKLLIELTFKLNKIHGTQHKTIYWRILIGPWLAYFLQITFDRWSSIQSAINNFQLSGTYIESLEKYSLIPRNMNHFTRMSRSEEWNYFIYSYIIKNYTAVHCINQPLINKIIKDENFYQFQFTRRLKEKFFNYINYIAGLFQREDDAFFISTYLSKKNHILLQLKFSQIPTFNFSTSLQQIDLEIEREKRQWTLEGDNSNRFETFVRSIIAEQIPLFYLEGYNHLSKKVSSLSWPSKPKFIFTSSSFIADDLFKFYLAKKKEEGSPLVIGQHGGGIGTHLFAFYEKHQLDICDLYLSWGWTDNSKKNIKPTGILKYSKPLGVNHESQSRISLLALRLPSQSNHISSAPIASQLLSYFNDQCEFINSLNTQIKDNLTVRLWQIEKGFEPSIERWNAAFPDITFDYGFSNLNKLLKKSKLCIATYNATTFLETFSMDVPTIMFWNPNHWELREAAKMHFNKLKEVGVFHETPKSAAKHVNMIWKDVNSWWNSEVVKDAIFSFKNNYCKQSNYLVGQIYSKLQNVIKKN